MKNTTIKDIAMRCGVTPAVASVALRNKKGSIRYSSKIQKNILSVASELNYHPNRFAQAMITGTIPYVGVALFDHYLKDKSISYYFYDIISSSTRILHENGLQAVMIPYKKANEQTEKIKYLCESRLVGGIITNFVESNKDFLINYLKGSGLPYAILGRVDDDDIISSYLDFGEMDKVLLKYAEINGYSSIIKISLIGGGLFEVLGNGRYLPIENIDKIKDANILLASNGVECTDYLKSLGIQCGKMITIDDARTRGIPAPSIVFKVFPNVTRAEICSKLLSGWMLSGIKPEMGPRIVKISRDDFEFIGGKT